ncbi:MULTISPECIES: hypothetical protein [Bacillati]|uniref:hypothetical protein n=1 Tax=Bacillati TaxID=1783272 RepID=UPI0008DDCE10|nr:MULTISPECIES: hypothetical protein [Terrabacteria group]MDX5577437.1 hypothetical protein [Streptomyces sp. ID01-9D]OHY73282.1 hypothetical protein BCV52_27155 [Priestia aryabhattai]
MSDQLQIKTVTDLVNVLEEENFDVPVLVEGNGEEPFFEVTKLEGDSGTFYEVKHQGQGDAEFTGSLDDLIKEYAPKMGLTQD